MVVLSQRSIIASSEHAILVQTYMKFPGCFPVGGGKTNAFHRKHIIIFHVSKYYMEAAAWVAELSQVSSKIKYFLLRSIYIEFFMPRTFSKPQRFNSRAPKRKKTKP